MIEIQSNPLSSEQSDRIRKWLNAPERFELERVVRSSIADLIARGSSKALIKPSHFLTENTAAPAQVEIITKMKEASLLKIFLDVLNLVSNPKHEMSISRLSIDAFEAPPTQPPPPEE